MEQLKMELLSLQQSLLDEVMGDDSGEIIAPTYAKTKPIKTISSGSEFEEITEAQRQEAERNAKEAVASINKMSTHLKTEKKMIAGKQMEVVEEWIGNPKQKNLYVATEDEDIE